MENDKIELWEIFYRFTLGDFIKLWQKNLK